MLSNFLICLEAAIGDVLWKWIFLGVSRDSRESACDGVSGAGVFPVSFAKVWGNAFFTEYLWTTASVWSFYILKVSPVISCKFIS